MSRRMLQLDVLRAIAVIMVLAHHMPDTFGSDSVKSLWMPIQKMLAAASRCGWSGVDLFFVLSGFLVSGLLFREHKKHGSISISRFLVRRGLKIYPSFWVMLIISVWVRHATNWGNHSCGPMSNRTVINEILFIQNYTSQVWSHTWSLAVEEHFYILLALGLLLLWKRQRKSDDPFRAIVPVFFIVAVLILIARLVTSYVYDYYWTIHLTPTHLRMDSLLFGVFLSYLSVYREQPTKAFVERHRRMILAASLPLVLLTLVFRPQTFFMHSVGFTCLYLAYGGIMMVLVNTPKFGSGSAKWLTSALGLIGSHSYSIYLWHFGIAVCGGNIQKLVIGRVLPYPLSLALYVAASIVVGVLMAKLVEFPVLRIRDRLYPSRGTDAVSDGPRSDESSNLPPEPIYK